MWVLLPSASLIYSVCSLQLLTWSRHYSPCLPTNTISSTFIFLWTASESVHIISIDIHTDTHTTDHLWRIHNKAYLWLQTYKIQHLPLVVSLLSLHKGESNTSAAIALFTCWLCWLRELGKKANEQYNYHNDHKISPLLKVKLLCIWQLIIHLCNLCLHTCN